jgi:hypothetical protein
MWKRMREGRERKRGVKRVREKEGRGGERREGSPTLELLGILDPRVGV